jgi:hypothetical protein
MLTNSSRRSWLALASPWKASHWLQCIPHFLPGRFLAHLSVSPLTAPCSHEIPASSEGKRLKPPCFCSCYFLGPACQSGWPYCKKLPGSIEKLRPLCRAKSYFPMLTLDPPCSLTVLKKQLKDLMAILDLATRGQ